LLTPESKRETRGVVCKSRANVPDLEHVLDDVLALPPSAPAALVRALSRALLAPGPVVLAPRR